MMLRVIASLAIAIFLFQFFVETEADAVGLGAVKSGGQGEAGLTGEVNPIRGTVRSKRSIEAKDVNDRMKLGDDQKPWGIVRFIFWLKEIILWPFRQIWWLIQKVIDRFL